VAASPVRTASLQQVVEKLMNAKFLLHFPELCCLLVPLTYEDSTVPEERMALPRGASHWLRKTASELFTYLSI
jgi:hypothetical protein